MHYTASGPDDTARERRRTDLLRALGAAVRKQRNDLGLTMRGLGGRAGVSERFLAQLETGEGNISVARLQDVADALGTTAAALLEQGARAAAAPSPRQVIALLGLRGAGKSTLGPEVARRLGVSFFELDALVAREAGMPLSTIFEMHGEAWFRKLELEVLRAFLEAHETGVLATGGAIVTSREAFELLRRRTTTVWLKASAQDHWNRVLHQGDVRPMKNRDNAMSELKALLRTRKALYSLAAHVVDTSSTSFDEAAAGVVGAVTLSTARGPSRGSAGARRSTRR